MLTLNSSDPQVKPETCSVLSALGDTLRIHYTVRRQDKNSLRCHVQCEADKTVRSAMDVFSTSLMTNTVIVYVALSAPTMWTQQTDLHTETGDESTADKNNFI